MKNQSNWPTLLDEFNRAADQSAELAAARTRFVVAARKALGKPLVRRVYQYKDVGRHRTFLDGRSFPLTEPTQTIFGLAMSDHGACNTLATELPMLAAAARLTGDEKLTKRVQAQLHEMAAWSPLQRSGWSAYGGKLAPNGIDGNWLATGTGMRAIADTLEIMPPELLPPATVARLHQLMAAEIVSIVEDWRVERQWFIYGKYPLTNQWVLPTEGLIRACLVLGPEAHAEAYELGVANLMKHLEAHGTQGAFEEGIHYADFTVTSLLACARAMALAGDRRAIDHPFLRQYPVWALHHFQPGGFYINAFDAFSAARGNKALMRELLALSAIALESREALWALEHLAGGADDSLPGILTNVLPQEVNEPNGLKPYAAYERATRVNWRSDWTDGGTGVWVRGGHEMDSHDHLDRGHVNVIFKGKPVFIEAGTPAYHNKALRIDFHTGRGHNVLQLGTAPRPDEIADYTSPPGWQKLRTVAPITVNRLDAKGGDIIVDGTHCYDGLQQWLRQVAWQDDEVIIDDTVVLEAGAPQVVLFRWHLGISRPPRIALNDAGGVITWPGVRLAISADTPLSFTLEPMPDHTLRFRKWEDMRPDNMHQCLVVQTPAQVEKCKIQAVAQAV